MPRLRPILAVLVAASTLLGVEPNAIGRMKAGAPQIVQSAERGDGSSTGGLKVSSRPELVTVDRDVPFRDFLARENGTDPCRDHWRLGYVVSACSMSHSADQLVFQLSHVEVEGSRIVDHLQMTFDAHSPKRAQDVVTYEVLEGQYMCLNRTWIAPDMQSCQCGCDRVVRLHFAMEVPLHVDTDQVDRYMQDSVVGHLNSLPGVCAAEVDTAETLASQESMGGGGEHQQLADVRFGSPGATAVTFQRTLMAPGNLSPVVPSSLCYQEDWRTSFDTRGWSSCPQNAARFMSGLYRSQWGSEAVSQSISMLDRVQCCEAPITYRDVPTAYRTADWSASLSREGWSFCPGGYYLNGLYRSSYSSKADLKDVEAARCARPASHPLQHGECYDEDISEAFNSVGWVSCSKPNYYVVGMYQNGNHSLRDVDLLRCCKMFEEEGLQPDLVQELPASSITASACYSDFTSRGMHPVLGKRCTTRGFESDCIKYRRPAGCVAEGLVLGDNRPAYQTTSDDGPYIVVDLGRARHVGHGVLLGRGDRAPSQKILEFTVQAKSSLEDPWEAVGGAVDSEFSDFGNSAKDQAAPFTVDRRLRFLRVQAVRCNAHCALRLQLFEHLRAPQPSQAPREEQPGQPTRPRSMEMWTCAA